MNFLNNIRHQAGLYFLHRNTAKFKRTKRVCSFGKAKTFVLLYETKTPDIPQAIQELTQLLRKENKVVHGLMFYSGEEKLLSRDESREEMMFTVKDLSLFFKPSETFMKKLKEIEADYIIDLNLNDCLPLLYIAGLSTAHLRIGKHSKMRLPFFDLLIQDKSDNQQDLIRHILHYIKILNPNQHE